MISKKQSNLNYAKELCDVLIPESEFVIFQDNNYANNVSMCALRYKDKGVCHYTNKKFDELTKKEIKENIDILIYNIKNY